MSETELLNMLDKFREQVIEAFASLEVEIDAIQHALIEAGVTTSTQYLSLRVKALEVKERHMANYFDVISPLRKP